MAFRKKTTPATAGDADIDLPGEDLAAEAASEAAPESYDIAADETEAEELLDADADAAAVPDRDDEDTVLPNTGDVDDPEQLAEAEEEAQEAESTRPQRRRSLRPRRRAEVAAEVDDANDEPAPKASRRPAKKTTAAQADEDQAAAEAVDVAEADEPEPVLAHPYRPQRKKAAASAEGQGPRHRRTIVEEPEPEPELDADDDDEPVADEDEALDDTELDDTETDAEPDADDDEDDERPRRRPRPESRPAVSRGSAASGRRAAAAAVVAARAKKARTPSRRGKGIVVEDSRVSSRIGAYIVDVLAWALFVVVYALVPAIATGWQMWDFSKWNPESMPTYRRLIATQIWLVGAPILFFLLYTWLPTARGGTAGKRAFGLRLVRVGTVQPLGMGRALWRIIVQTVLSIPVWLGMIPTAVAKNHRGLQDKAAGSEVVVLYPAGEKAPIGPVTFVKQCVAELRKVVWPSGNQLKNYFIVVLIFVLVVIAFVSLIDLGVGTLLLRLLG